MLRKTLLALATCVTLGAAALAPTSASAYWGGGWHNGWHGGWGYRPGFSGLCGPGLWRLHGSALGLHVVWTGAALGQSLLLI